MSVEEDIERMVAHLARVHHTEQETIWEVMYRVSELVTAKKKKDLIARPQYWALS